MTIKIDLNKITGKWKQWAEDADKVGNNDGTILNSTFEVEYVRNQAKIDKVPDNEIGEILGDSGASPLTDGFTPSKRAQKKDNRTLQDYMVGKLVDDQTNRFFSLSTDKPNWNIFVDNIRASLMATSDNLGDDKDYYSALIQEMESVAKVMNEYNYQNKKHVLGLYTIMQKRLGLDKYDESSKFKLKVVQKFMEIAEQHQVKKEKQQVENRFKKLREQGMSRANALALVKEEFKGSYFEDYTSWDVKEVFQGLDQHPEKEYVHNGILTNFENENVPAEARGQVESAVNMQRAKCKEYLKKNDAELKQIGLNEKQIQDVKTLRTYLEENNLYDDYIKPKTKSIEVKSDAEIYLRALNQWDSYAESALNGEQNLGDSLKGKRSKMKALRKSVSYENLNGERKATPFTQKEFTKILRDDTIFQALKGVGNINDITLPVPLVTQNEEKNENGELTYNLSNLSNVIALHLGANLAADKTSGIMKPYSEVENTIIDISTKLGVKNISKHDVKKLIELCGFEVQGNNWVRIVYDATVGTAIDTLIAVGGILGVEAASTASATATASAVSIIDNYNVGPADNVSKVFEVPYSKTLVDQFIDNTKLHVDLNVLLNGIGNLEVDWDSFFDNNNLSYKDIHFENIGNSLHIVIDKTNTSVVDIVRRFNEQLELMVSSNDLPIDWSTCKVDIQHHAEAKVDKTETEVDQKKKVKKAIIRTVILQLVANAFKAWAAEQNRPEVPIAVTQFENTSIEEYLGRLDRTNMDANLKLGLKALAAGFVEKNEKGEDVIENGKRKWDCDAYKAFLNRCAGDASVLNEHEGYITFTKIDEIIKELQKGISITAKPKEQTVAPAKVDAPKVEQKSPVMPEMRKVEETTPVESPQTVVQAKAVTPAPNPDDVTAELVTEKVEANYHNAHRHTWGGIVALYADTGRSRAEIIAEIRKVNNMKSTDNVFKPDMYLPDDLFNDGKKKKTFTSDNDQEKYMYQHDDKIKKKAKVIRSSGEYKGVQPLGWRGVNKTKGKETKEIYQNPLIAEEEARKLD